jgi:predicted enzyme related to lactoylglutathione lyase
MVERDEYPAGVPCWVDTQQPDPEAAMTFYGDLFGWSFDDRSGPEQPYFVAQLRGRDVAGIGQTPPGYERPSASPMWNTHVAVESADRTAAKVRWRGAGFDGALRRSGGRTHGCVRRLVGRDVLCLAG